MKERRKIEREHLTKEEIEQKYGYTAEEQNQDQAFYENYKPDLSNYESEE